MAEIKYYLKKTIYIWKLKMLYNTLKILDYLGLILWTIMLIYNILYSYKMDPLILIYTEIFNIMLNLKNINY